MAATRTRNTFRIRSSQVAPGVRAGAIGDNRDAGRGRLGIAMHMKSYAIGNVDWGLWFAILSPIIGVLFGVLGVFVLAH